MRLARIYLCLALIFTIIPAISYAEENCACNALLSAFKFLGIDVTEEEIAHLTPPDEDGLTSMYDLLQAAKTKGLNPKALNLTYQQLIHTPMPVITHLTTQHFITLKEAKEDGIILIDKTKETFITKDKFLTTFSGYTLTFNPNTKGTALSNNQLKGIKGAHCTCGGCNVADCGTDTCGGSLACSSANCNPGSSCPGGGICLFCPDKSSPVCGGSGSQYPCECPGSGCPQSGATRSRCSYSPPPPSEPCVCVGDGGRSSVRVYYQTLALNVMIFAVLQIIQAMQIVRGRNAAVVCQGGQDFVLRVLVLVQALAMEWMTGASVVETQNLHQQAVHMTAQMITHLRVYLPVHVDG